MRKGRYYIVRGDRSGVFAGYISERYGTAVTMTDVRRLLPSDGDCSISRLAMYGITPADCFKFDLPVGEILILDAVEIDTCSADAAISIMAAG